MSDGLTDMARDWNEGRDKRRKRFYYQWNKDHGICVECGKKPSLAVRVKCMDCIERETERKNASN